MARGSKSGVNEDPRWEGQDSLSLPNRPAHPDPSRVFEATDGSADDQPVHGIRGFAELKHNLATEAEVAASQQAVAQAEVDAAEESHEAVKARAQSGDERAKAALKGSEANLKSAKDRAGSVDDVEPEGEEALREAILSGEVVPSIEAADHVEDSAEGKRTDSHPGNAPKGTGQDA